MPFGCATSIDGTLGSSRFSLGAAAGANNTTIGLNSRDAQTTSATGRRHSNVSVYEPLTNANAVYLSASLDTFNADGFSLGWGTTLGFETILNHICLGGADLEVSLTQHQMNATNDPQSFAHGLSGAPTGLMFLSVLDSTDPPSTSTFLVLNIGAHAGSNQFSAAFISNNAATTTLTRRLLATNTVVSSLSSGGAIARSMAVASVDATNVNVTYPVAANTNQRYFWMLAIRGAKCQVGTFDCNGSLDPLTIATPGITPKLFLPVFVSQGVDSVNTVMSDIRFAIGASDGTNNVSCGITDRNGVTTTNARRYQSSNSLVEYGTIGNLIFEATASFSGESVILNPTTNNSDVMGQGGYLVIGS
jgi:hypothetical protein